MVADDVGSAVQSSDELVTTAADGTRQFSFWYRDRPFCLAVNEAGTLWLHLDGVLRKEGLDSGKSPLYVWTNVELQWEEHHYLEARYWPDGRRLEVTVNRMPLHQVHL